MYLTYVEIHKYFTYTFKIILKISNLSLYRFVNFLLPIKIGLRKIFPLNLRYRMYCFVCRGYLFYVNINVSFIVMNVLLVILNVLFMLLNVVFALLDMLLCYLC